ncbi:CHAT domain-containing protein [Burkholderia sp. D7]|nr:CHAT domain-containing protein [Burkholderia sp. D7]
MVWEGSGREACPYPNCHGWKGDVPAAIEQYDLWVAATGAAEGDLARIRQNTADFAPLIIGLHWPSLPWGIESLPEAAPAPASATLSAAGGGSSRTVAQIAAAIVNTEAAKRAIETVLAEADTAKSANLTLRMHEAYMTLFAQTGLRADGVNGRPGFDQERFDPQAIVNDARKERPAGKEADSRVLGIADELKDALLSPLRQLSFWAMKDRARRFGETAGHWLLDEVQLAAPKARVHLMGHSFGCIVVSAMVAGPRDGSEPLERPVDSLFLAQGALSLWSYANEIPFAMGSKGYFHRIVADGLVRGPTITTRSSHDTAVGRFYPLGARIKHQRLLGAAFPEYGGVGAFGIQGIRRGHGGDLVGDMRMTAGDVEFALSEQRIWNLDASEVICNGTGPSGAHSDIAHPEVAHAFWAGVSGAIDIAKKDRSTRGKTVRPPWGKKHEAAQPHADQRTRGGLLNAGATRGGTLSAKPAGLGAQVEAHNVPGFGAVEPPIPAAAPASTAAAANATPSRWINASFEGLDPSEPLLMGKWYQLAFDVDIEVRFDVIAATKFPEGAVASAGAGDVIFTVQIDTNDFDLSGRVSQMRVPREGPGHTRARFDVSPYRNGRASIKATILRDGNFIQQMDLTFDVGAQRQSRASVVVRGRALSAASLLLPRNVGLSIEPGDGGYRCTVWGPVSAHARLCLTPGFLDDAINAARSALAEVIEQSDNGDPVFQACIDIPEDQSEKALRTLARAGANLLIKLFDGPSAGPDSKAVGTFLRKLCGADAPRLKIQILAEQLPIPWGLLYLGDAREGAKLDWNNFLGMRHIVEQIPLQPSLNVWDHGIASDEPSLAVSVNFNETIDDQFPQGYVRKQQAFWQKTNLGVTTRLTRADVLNALNNVATRDQILYFYCHAISYGLNQPGGPDASSLVLTDKPITLEDFRLDAPTEIQLSGNPLVFINACQSSKLSPTFYDGFVPYFMSKGARGVIGTECDTPAYFAMEWAQRFFQKFLGGKPLGETFLELRQEFVEQHHNPLGLLYAVHCDADTIIDPPSAGALAA